MTVPIQISWDLHLGRVAVWCETLAAGVRRAVLLPPLDTIFSPVEQDPTRELPREELDWRLVSQTEEAWARYRALVEKETERHGIRYRVQRVENVARCMGGRQVAVPQFHTWIYREEPVAETIDPPNMELDRDRRRGIWRWLLAWTAPAENFEPCDPR